MLSNPEQYGVKECFEYIETLLPELEGNSMLTLIDYMSKAGYTLAGLVGAQEDDSHTHDGITLGPVFSVVLWKKTKELKCDLNDEVQISATITAYSSLDFTIDVSTAWESKESGWVTSRMRKTFTRVDKLSRLVGMTEYVEIAELQLQHHNKVCMKGL